MKFKQDEIIFLMGAGISADAGIPVSSKMIGDIGAFLQNKGNEWGKYKDLYHLVKSGVNFSYGIQGKESIFNVEILVNVLNELEKKESHPLYPFIGSWSVKFNEVINNDFSLIENFKKQIIEQLKKWMQPNDIREASYLSKIIDIRNQIQFPIRIFTLNYDLLIEKIIKEKEHNKDYIFERGFELNDRNWNYKRFSENDKEPDIYLYKLHGSIDWQRDSQTNVVKYVDSIPDFPDLIFGTQYKMQYVDPYLFLISEFRHYCLKAKLIVCLGYSFSDEHINSILSQALSYDKEKKIYALAYNEKEERIKQVLNLNNSDNRVIIKTDQTAKDFFEKYLSLETFEKLFENEENNDVI